jgi:hypothetical protein
MDSPTAASVVTEAAGLVGFTRTDDLLAKLQQELVKDA